jgi:hypothetical protein
MKQDRLQRKAGTAPKKKPSIGEDEGFTYLE